MAQKNFTLNHLTLFLDPESPRRIKMKKLTRELHNVKRKLEELENEFENSPGGYRLSHAEKQKHKPMRKLLNEQSRLKRQIRYFFQKFTLQI